MACLRTIGRPSWRVGRVFTLILALVVREATGLNKANFTANVYPNPTYRIVQTWEEDGPPLQLYPPQVDQLVEEQVGSVYFNHSRLTFTAYLRIESENPEIAKIVGRKNFSLSDLGQRQSRPTEDGADWNNSMFQVQGVFLGRTAVKFYLIEDESADAGTQPNSGSQSAPLNITLPVSVIRAQRAIDNVFIVLVAVMVFVANIGMGCKIDMDVVKEALKKPIAPVIGFCCQFLAMPMLAYGIIKLLGLHGGQALGFFAIGCAPGGGASNMFTYLLGGDVSLSVTMTLVSTLASLGMIPLWLFTLGQTLMDETGSNVKIPFSNIVLTLLSIIIPVGIGIVIQRKKPRLSSMIVKMLRPGFIFFLVFMFTFGVYANLYIFKLFTPLLIVGGCMLPYIGFTLGACIAFAFKQPHMRIIAIGIETGIQNTGMPILLTKFSLPQPEADLSIVSPIVVATFTPIPLLLLVMFLEIRKRCCKKTDKGFERVDSRGSPGEESLDNVNMNNGQAGSRTSDPYMTPTENGGKELDALAVSNENALLQQ